MSDNTVVTENTITNVVEVTSAGPAGPPGGALTIQDEGVDEGLLTDKINFVGSTVSVVNDTEAEIATITVNAADPGANTNITSLGGIAGGISSPDYVQFDTAAAAAGAVGRLLWNDTDGTLEFQLKGGNVTLQIGQEQVVRVTNKSGVTMTDGQAVYITGSTGNHLNVTLAQANTEATSSKTLAIVTETIANNGTGFATSAGLVRGLNTSALTEGAAIWLSATVPGGLTTIRPTAPDHAVLIGWCVRQSATVGAIFVHIANGYELDELHDVLITAASNNQVLRYDAVAKVWKNATVSPTLTLIGDVSGSATFTDLGNATLTATVADDSHNHIISNVDGLQAALDSKLLATDYNAADVLTKIKTVDGTGSGLDADLLDGQDGAHYLDFTNATNKPDPTITLAGDATGSVTLTDLASGTLNVTVVDDSHNHVIANVDGLQDALDAKLPSASYTATDVLDKIKTVDGAGSGLDADLLDGQSSAYYTAINDRLGYTAENAANKGVAGGYASLDGAGLVPATQLPSYVDDVLEFTNVAAFPVTGETGKIYVAVDTSKTYRWSGSTYVEISASPGSTDAVPEGSSNLYFTAARARQSISASGSLSYDNNTGVMSFTDAVTSVAGRTGDITLSTSDVSEGTNLYHTTARVRSSISASGSLAYDNVTGVVSYTTPNTDGITEGAANLYHTTARARASVSAGTGISYDSATGVITNAAPDQTVSITGSGTTTVTGTYPNFTVSSADQYVGTVTSVSGTGTVNGLTLTGTVTSSGSLTLGGTLIGVDLTSAVTGTLPVTKGGTGTTTQFTAGSVVFAGASGVYSQDNAQLFWDYTNNRLGIGTTTPSAKLDVAGSISSTATVSAASDFRINNQSYTRVAQSDGAGSFVGGYNVKWSTGVKHDSTGAISALYYSSNGSVQFYTGTSQSADTAATTRMIIDSAGSVGIGTASPNGKLNVNSAAGASVSIGYNNTSVNYFDANTQIFRTGSFAETMRIDSAGNVAVGTTNVGYGKLGVYDATNTIVGIANSTSYAQLQQVGANLYINWNRSGAAGGDLVFRNGATDTERMRITAAGDVGIGTSSPGAKLDVVGGSDVYATLRSTSQTLAFNAGTGIVGSASTSIYNTSAIPMVFGTNNTERARIDSSGNLLVGKTVPSPTTVGFQVYGDSSSSQFGAIASTLAQSNNTNTTMMVYSTGAGAYRFYVDMAGTVFATSTTISAISDIRLKENVRDLDAGLNTILALKPRRFDWKEGKGKDIKDDMGFIAQEVEEVLPALIGGWKAGEGEPDDLKSVKAGDLIPVLVKAIQELTARVAQLEGN